jgi:hypothetical protein
MAVAAAFLLQWSRAFGDRSLLGQGSTSSSARSASHGFCDQVGEVAFRSAGGQKRANQTAAGGGFDLGQGVAEARIRAVQPGLSLGDAA